MKKRTVHISITNRGKGRGRWPDWFVLLVGYFLLERAGITGDYDILLRGVGLNTTSGRGWAWKCHISYNRRCPYGFSKDHRYSWATNTKTMPGIDSFVFLLAHEIRHATDDNRRKFKPAKPGGRRRIARGEYDANTWAMEALAAWREQWPEARFAFRKLVQAKRSRRARQATEALNAKSIKRTTAYKITRANEHLDAWLARAAACKWQIKHYRRKISALHGAQKRAAASMGS